VDPLPALFFVSYMLMASLVLINIIIAVLLDEFLTTMARSRAQMKQEEANHEVEAHPFDPLMAALSRYKSFPDLVESIRNIFNRLDESGDGELDQKELTDGLPRIFPDLVVTNEDWHTMIDNHPTDAHHDSDPHPVSPNPFIPTFGNLGTPPPVSSAPYTLNPEP
jgi:hypothetical protein